eukprot:3356784-Rhodomonas_salina.1
MKKAGVGSAARFASRSASSASCPRTTAPSWDPITSVELSSEERSDISRDQRTSRQRSDESRSAHVMPDAIREHQSAAPRHVTAVTLEKTPPPSSSAPPPDASCSHLSLSSALRPSVPPSFPPPLRSSVSVSPFVSVAVAVAVAVAVSVSVA